MTTVEAMWADKSTLALEDLAQRLAVAQGIAAEHGVESIRGQDAEVDLLLRETGYTVRALRNSVRIALNARSSKT